MLLPKSRMSLNLPKVDGLYIMKHDPHESAQRVFKIDPCRVHFTFYQDPDLHACPYISLLITQGSQLKISLAIQGIYAPEFSKSIPLRFGLRTLLQDLARATPCSGYYGVWNEDSCWEIRQMPRTVGGKVHAESRSVC